MADTEQGTQETLLSERTKDNLPWLSGETIANILHVSLGREFRTGQRFAAPPWLRILGGLVYSVRPWQWYKQGILLIAIVFSGSLFSVTAWTNVLLGITAFCIAAGGIYTINDIIDLDADRRHPTKRNRPIASGTLSVGLAFVYGIGLLVIGSALSIQISEAFTLVIGLYIVQNLIYSVYLKHVLFVDVLVIALGFVWRAIAGVVAIGTELSAWLIVCAFLAALLLALGKRRSELATVEDITETRPILDGLSPRHLDDLMAITAGTLLMAYTLYTVVKPNSLMMVTLPFAYFGVFWYYILVQSATIGERPERLLVNRPFLVNTGLWLTSVVIVIYLAPDLSGLLR